MASLLSCRALGKSFGDQQLFDGIDLVLEPGDRVGLIGPNGSGKSTLLRIICGLEEPDRGRVILRRHTRVGFLAQSDTFTEEKNAVDNLSLALQGLDLDEAERHRRVHAILSRAEFPDADCPVHLLSGGWRKRLAICRALVVHPDVLVMDEPTNHLDIEGILWLERLLCARQPESPAAFLLVSHDRRFLENSVNRVVELSGIYPGGSFQVRGNYTTFLEKRYRFLARQQDMERRLANKVRRETEWLRRGPKARSSKARFRIDEAHRLRDELTEVRTRNRSEGQVRIGFDATGRKTKKLLTATGLGKAYGDRVLFRDLDLVLSPGTRLGLLGRNGCGKSTLMAILAGAAEPDGTRPDSGNIVLAENVRIVSFDQRREQLDQSLTLRRALAPDGDSVVYQGHSVHVAAWAGRFLFRSDQLETPVSRLSGGEQARILIARLMLRPADILLLDEPTNDLDIPSLDVLEESLREFPGALVLVTHDRFLLERLCDQVLGFDGRGGVEYYADHEQWLAALGRKQGTPATAAGEGKTRVRGKNRRPGRLSYLDQREYEQMEETILAREEEQEELQRLMQAPEIQADAKQLQEYWQRARALEEEIETLYERWQELEQKKAGTG